MSIQDGFNFFLGKMLFGVAVIGVGIAVFFCAVIIEWATRRRR